MQTFIAPDLLTDMRELPVAAMAVLVVVGTALWVAGWWLHRFWVVLASTLGAGLIGLRVGPDFGLQPIVAGLLAGVAAGALALSLVRVAMFAGCGLGCWLAAQAVAPAWAEPLVCTLVGGLLGVLLFRFWIIVVSSAGGTILMGYGGLLLAERLGKFDAVQWVSEKPLIVNIGFGVAVFLGLVLQYFLERAKKRYKEWKQEVADLHLKQTLDGESKSWTRFLKRAG